MMTLDIQKYQTWIKSVQKYFGLEGWNISVSADETAPDDSVAAARFYGCERKAVVMLHPDFFKDAPRQQRWSLTHELLHIAHHRVQEAVENCIRKSTGELGWGAFQAGHKTLVESFIDDTSGGLVDLLPGFEDELERPADASV